MLSKRQNLIAASVAASLALSSAAAHAATVNFTNGTLTPGPGGLQLVSLQTNVTTSLSADNGGEGGVANEATATTTGAFTNISNAYGQITGSNLTLFLGGSLEDNPSDSEYVIALQLNSHGVTSLAGQTIAGGSTAPGAMSSFDSIQFSNGFKPTALFTVFPGQGQVPQNGTFQLGPGVHTTVGETYGVFYTDLTGMGYVAPSSVQAVLNNALLNTAVGAGGPGDPGFAGADTGLAMSIPLSTLGYTPGDSINALVFPITGSDTRTDNQILAPFSYGTDATGSDYTYIGTSNSSDGSQVGRQFVQSVYPGPGYFTISEGTGATVPEPATLGILALGLPLMLRRPKRDAKKA